MDKLSIILSISCLLIFDEINAMSKQQLKNTLKLPKKTCMTKNEVTDDQVGNIEQGQFLEERNVMCYIACMYQMTSIVKNNRLNYEATMKQIDAMYPNDFKETARAAVDFCTNISLKYKNDLCKSSFYSAKCVYEFSPKYFIFP